MYVAKQCTAEVRKRTCTLLDDSASTDHPAKCLRQRAVDFFKLVLRVRSSHGAPVRFRVQRRAPTIV